MRRRVLTVTLAVVLVAVSVGCRPARAGTRCSGNDWGDDGSFVLACRGGRWVRVMTRGQAATALSSLLRAGKAPAVGSVVRPTSFGAPNLPNTADPSVYVDGATTYVYATSTWLRVPVVALPSPETTVSLSALYSLAHDAMPQRPAWAASTEIWAPTVSRIGGRMVMFFAAHRTAPPDPTNDQCVGRATADSPTGPFVPDASPVSCGADGVHGALDPSIFVGPDGAAHLLVAMGGSATNIWTYPLGPAGDISGPPTSLLTRAQPWQDHFLENPAMFYDGSTYLLAYSAGHWDSAAYMEGLARCASPTGPCTDRPDGPWLSSLGDRVGPGGLEFFVGPDGVARVAFESYAAGDVGPVGKRSTHIRPFVTDPWPRLG